MKSCRFFTTCLMLVLAACTGARKPSPSPQPPEPTIPEITPGRAVETILAPSATLSPSPTVAPTATATPPLTPTWAWTEPTQPATVTPLPFVTADPEADTLRAAAQNRNFYIGVAVNNGLVKDTEYAALLGQEFNMLVTENAMKFGLIHPEPGRYDFAPADEIVNFALARSMKTRGHTLVWQKQMPRWLEYGEWSRQQLIDVLHEHITTVVGRYRGQVYAWDVVNEGVGTRGLAPSFWYKTLGPDYIDLAFQWAHAADPDALLFYNDYSAEGMNVKADSVYNLVKDMKERGIPIDGVGMQFHMVLGHLPPMDQVAENMRRLGELGLQVHITELDIRIEEPATAEKFTQQAQEYRSILETCLAAPNCTAFVMWGMTDQYSWIPSVFKGYGTALIFDDAYQPKPAYQSLLEGLNK